MLWEGIANVGLVGVSEDEPYRGMPMLWRSYQWG